MEAYFVRSKDNQGGYFDLYRTAPVMENERKTIVEVRKGNFPPEKWLKISMAETKPDPEVHFDKVYEPYWEKAKVWWTREGGYVDGS